MFDVVCLVQEPSEPEAHSFTPSSLTVSQGKCICLRKTISDTDPTEKKTLPGGMWRFLLSKYQLTQTVPRGQVHEAAR